MKDKPDKNQHLRNDEADKESLFQSVVPFWPLMDLDQINCSFVLMIWRIFQALFLTYNMAHPDEYWQAVEPAYNMVYGGVQLTWEWDPQYRLRSTIYPSYLAVPLYFLKITGLDYAWAVRACPQVAHIVLVIMCDQFLWFIGKQTVGKNATRVAFLFLLINRIYNEIITRCFSNSIETIFQTAAFYYFLQVKNKFDKNVVLLTALLTVSFMIRNTSPIGWPPLLLLKIIKDGSLVPLIFAGVFVFIPVVGLCVLIDSFYYGDFPVITAYNFVKANLAEGLSKYFGTEPFHFYLFAVMPLIFTAALPCAYLGPVIYAKDMLKSKGQIPYIAILSGFYLLVFSIIAHKEPRFLLPIVPLLFLTVGYFVAKGIKGVPRLRGWIKAYIWIAIIVEVVMSVFFLNMQFRNWEVLAHLQAKEVAPHSVFSMQALDSPLYSWTHRKYYLGKDGIPTNRTIVYRSNKNPTYARLKLGIPVPILHDHDFNSCFQLIDDLAHDVFLPEYVILYDFTCADNFYCSQLCISKFEQTDKYELEATFKTDIEPREGEPYIFYRRQRYLYRLKDGFVPK